MKRTAVCLNFIIALTIGAILALPIIAVADDTGLTASWNFNVESDKVLAATTGDAVGTIHNLGTNAKWINGKNGKALLFTGAKGEHNCGGVQFDKSPVDFTKSFTVETTIKFLPDAPYREFKEIISWCDAERGPGMRIYNFYGMMTIRTGDGDKNLADVRTNSSAVKIPADRWFHLVVTYDSEAEKAVIYFDGSKVAEGPLKITPRVKSSSLALGSYRAGYANAMRGAIDDLKIYAKAKNENEVAEAYLTNIQ